MAKIPGRFCLAVCMLLGWASVSPIPLWAENQDRRLPSAPPIVSDNEDRIREGFMARLLEIRSIEKSKDAVMSRFGDLVRFGRNLQDRLGKLEGQIISLESKASAGGLSQSELNHQQVLLNSKRTHQNHVTNNIIHMDSLVAEYDVLSRMEELENNYKAKGIAKADFTSEYRGLKEELAHIQKNRQMIYLREDLMNELVAIKNQMIRMTQSQRSTVEW